MDANSGSFGALCAAGVFARFSYALARTPVLPLFASYLGAGPEIIVLVMGISTGKAEREADQRMVGAIPGRHRIIGGGDKIYDI